MKFIEALASGMDGASAARTAGYSAKNAGQTASLLMKSPAIRSELEKVKSQLRERTGYTLERMVETAEQDRAFARASGNAMAAVKASELIAKLHNLLVDRHELRVDKTISIKDNLDHANRRVMELLKDVTPVIGLIEEPNEENE